MADRGILVGLGVIVLLVKFAQTAEKVSSHG